MLVFIDESGDPGFKLQKGSSPFFVTSMVMFENGRTAAQTQEKISRLATELGIKPEFKFSKCCSDHRDSFFSTIAGCRFKCRFIVVDKSLIYPPHLMADKDSFYSFFLRMLLKHDGGTLRDARIIIDGSEDRNFKKQLKSYIRRHIPAESLKDLRLKDSQSDYLVQLADMTAGAVARSFRKDRLDADRWSKMLAANKQIDNLWNFK